MPFVPTPYTTELEADTYLASNAAYMAMSTSVKSTTRSKARIYLDSQFRYKGQTYSTDQEGAWPRTGFYSDGIYWPGGVVHDLVKQAECELAGYIANGTDLFPAETQPGQVKRVLGQVGPLKSETEYSTGRQSQPQFSYIRAMLKPLLLDGGGVILERA